MLLWKSIALRFLTSSLLRNWSRQLTVVMNHSSVGKSDSVSAASSSVADRGGVTPAADGTTGTGCVATVNTTTTPATPANGTAAAKHYSDHITRFTKLHAIDLVNVMHHDIQNAKTILDIGCGTGVFGLVYLDRFPNGIVGQTIVCTDLSQEMVHFAQRAIEEKTKTTASQCCCHTEFQFQVADGTQLSDFADDTFDMVVSVFGIFLIPDRHAVLNEVRRVLRPHGGGGGRLAMTAWTTTGYNEELRLAGFGANLHEAMSLMRLPLPVPTKSPPAEIDGTTTTTDIGTIHSSKPPPSLPPSPPQQMLPQFILDWFEPNQVKEMLADNAMFHDITVDRVIHSVYVPNVETMWNSFRSMKPSIDATTTTTTEMEQQQVVIATKIVLAEYITSTANSRNRTNNNDDDNCRPIFIRTASNVITATK